MILKLFGFGSEQKGTRRALGGVQNHRVGPWSRSKQFQLQKRVHHRNTFDLWEGSTGDYFRYHYRGRGTLSSHATCALAASQRFF